MANKFNYKVKLVPLQIINEEQDEFRSLLNEVPYLLYDVETLADGRKIVINKPGGKRSFGRLSKSDFMVFIYTPDTNELWLISHSEIYEDVEAKINYNKEYGTKVLNALEDVCNGSEPDCVLENLELIEGIGLSVELLLKVNKWIWGQEDVNYPNGVGRWLSMNALKKI